MTLTFSFKDINSSQMRCRKKKENKTFCDLIRNKLNPIEIREDTILNGILHVIVLMKNNSLLVGKILALALEFLFS